MTRLTIIAITTLIAGYLISYYTADFTMTNEQAKQYCGIEELR